MKALLIGLGGIGRNVYLPELKRIGYTVTTVDLKEHDADYNDVDSVAGKFDVAVICTPNFTHDALARKIATQCESVFIEKPGLPSAEQWNTLCEDYPKTRFIMCKNNLYRDSYGAIDDFLTGKEELIGIDVTWFNANRIPNPGTWSTNRRSAWGGVALDLFPHLYTQLVKVFGGVPDCQRGSHSMAQQWQLQDCIDSGTDYGNMDPNGIYNVCDYAQETWYVDDKYPINIRASWKQGYDDQSIKIYTEDSLYQWNFGLCPANAYGNMIATGITEPYDVHRQLDFWVHRNLEKYHEG